MVDRTVGVEEELLLVDPSSWRVTAVAGRALQDGLLDRDAPLEAELFLQQIETHTQPTRSLAELCDQLRAGRRAVVDAAAMAGAAAVAVASPVLADPATVDEITPQPRYRHIRDEYGELARSGLSCAMHVHVGIASPDEGVAALDRIGPWLPVLLALSTNSPYWHGRDTGHASWRSMTWWRWPSHGTGTGFRTVEEYDAVAQRLVDWGAALDLGMIYLDARLSPRYPTVEIRVADVTTEVGDAIVLAALGRALVDTDSRSGQRWRPELLRAMAWRAARYGLSDRLVHPGTLDLAPAHEVVDALVAHVGDALERHGDRDVVEEGVRRVFTRGTGATRQRHAFEIGGDLEAVVRDLADRTAASVT